MDTCNQARNANPYLAGPRQLSEFSFLTRAMGGDRLTGHMMYVNIPQGLMMTCARKMRAACLGVLLSLNFLSVAEAQLGKPDGLYYKSWAIVIGIEQYVVAPPISGAINDAKKTAEAFRRLGFDEVVELYDKDASSRRLQQLLNDMLPRKVGRMDRLVLVYVGHAGVMQDSDGQDRGYLVPFDASVNSTAKSITVEQLKEFTRRSASKHTLLILDAPVVGWETTESSGRSLEGRMAPESDAERRAVQVLSAASRGETVGRSDQGSRFVEALLEGLSGAADLDGDGWLMASELGSYLTQQVDVRSGGLQHPSSLRIDGDGDMALIEGKTAHGSTEK